MDMIHRWLEEHGPDTEAACVFACYALDLVRGYFLPVAVAPGLHLGSAPRIRPLAELQDEHEDFVFAAVDNEAARIRLVSSALIRQRDRIRGDVKNHVKKGGWSQKRYQRRRTHQLQDYAGEVAGRLHALSEEASCGRIVLLGSEETRTAILEELHETVRDRVVASEPTDVKQAEDQLLDQAYELYREAEREDERSLWQQIREEAFADGLAATGPQDVWFALANGRAEAVAIDRDLSLTATRCRDCENVTPQEAPRCAFCDSADVFATPFVEACVRQAERTSTDVDFMDPPPGLAKAGGVAALLRY
jgi:peptide subunit release factor 1 (eRF1)